MAHQKYRKRLEKRGIRASQKRIARRMKRNGIKVNYSKKV